MDFSAYKQKHADVKNNITSLAQIARKLNMTSVASVAEYNSKQLSNESFQLVVVGEFSRGKSTFVNALLGRSVLPSSKQPTTAVLSKIVYGPRPAYKLHYRRKGKPSKAISEEDFMSLVAPKDVDERDRNLVERFLHKQQSLDEIQFAEVAYPLDICRDNVEIVDTPGTNDLSTTRLDITYSYIDKADAVVMLLSAAQPLSASEMEFLRERILGNHIQDIFFVISYKDSLNSQDQEKRVVEFVKSNLQNVKGMPKNLRIHLVSSLQALLYRKLQHGEVLKPKQMLRVPDNLDTTGFLELESELGHFLSDEKGRAKLMKYADRGKEIAEQIYNDLNVRLDLASHSVDDLKAKVARMEPEFRKAKSEVERLTNHMKTNLQNGISDLENTCRIAAKDICKVAAKAVDDYPCNGSNIDKDDITAAVNKAVSVRKKQLIKDIEREQKKMVSQEVNKINTAIQKIWKDINLDITANSNLPAISGNNTEMDISINISSGFSQDAKDFGGWLVLGSVVGAVAGFALAPMALLFGIGGWLSGLFGGGNSDPKAKIRKQVNEHYSKESSQMASSVKDELSKQIDSICSDVRNSVSGRLADMEHQLKSALAKKQEQEASAEAEKKRLQKLQNDLKVIYKNLCKFDM